MNHEQVLDFVLGYNCFKNIPSCESQHCPYANKSCHEHQSNNCVVRQGKHVTMLRKLTYVEEVFNQSRDSE